jgi:mono/diheme cytochrome c family protein
MRQFLLFLLIPIAVFACANGASESEALTGNTTPTKPDGKKIYRTYCVTCHGVYGDMGSAGAYNLQESVLSVDERIAVITNGRNTMTAFKSLLSKKEIKAVAEYTLELAKDTE